MKRSRFKWLMATVVIVCAIMAYLLFFWPEPPSDHLQQARRELKEAEELRATQYAGIAYRNASDLYDSAMHHLRTENNRIFFLRDYRLVEKYALESSALAVTSAEKARSAAEDIRHMLAVTYERLEEELAQFSLVYGKVPLSETQRTELTRGKMLLHEGILAWQSSNYPVAMIKLDTAEDLIHRVASIAGKEMELYFESYPEWKQRAERSVEYSRKHKTTCILIDKYARSCMLYKNGMLVKSYPVELGSNWIGDKSHQGDKSTPEGSYRIISMKSQGETRYHKALLLDYPNAEDRNRFLANKKKGLIAKDVAIGGLIEIHGNGGKGADWTDGCIALSDSDMDHLFMHCSTGNEVLIVGSLKTLGEIMEMEGSL